MSDVPEVRPSACYEIRYRPLLRDGAWLTFPCDARGCVELDALGRRDREAYFYARAMVGREYARPALAQVAD